MEGLSRFDVAEHGGVSMVVIESDLLPLDPAVIVIPLLPDYPAVRYLNSLIRHEDRELVLTTRLITAVPGRDCIARDVSRTRATSSPVP